MPSPNGSYSPRSHQEAAARQQAVRELSTRLDLREDLALLGEDVRSGVRAALITDWGARPPIPLNPLLPPVAFILSITALIFALGLLFHVLPAWPVAAVLIVNGRAPLPNQERSRANRRRG